MTHLVATALAELGPHVPFPRTLVGDLRPPLPLTLLCQPLLASGPLHGVCPTIEVSAWHYICGRPGAKGRVTRACWD